MLSLTTAQRDVLRLLLASDAPIGAGALGAQLHLSQRQVQYVLRDVEHWLERRQAAVRNTPGVGLQVMCAPELRQQLQRDLAAYSRFQLILAPEQRQQLLALILLAAAEPLVLHSLQHDLAVARATVLKDLDLVEEWLAGFSLAVARRQHRGCWIEGQEWHKRQALAALLWGDVPFEQTILRVDDQAGIVFALADDAHLLPLVAQADALIRCYEYRSAKLIIEVAEVALGGQFTDQAVTVLQLGLAVQMQRVEAGQYSEWSDSTAEWVAKQPVWPIAEQLVCTLWPQLSPTKQQAEVLAFALALLGSEGETSWQHERFSADASQVIDHLLQTIAAASTGTAPANDQLLRDGLHALVLPACVRQHFGLWTPPQPLADARTAEYQAEHTLAHQLAEQVHASIGMELPEAAIDELTLLLRAAEVQAHAERERRVLIICPSGIATTQFLLARLRSRLPRLGNFEVLPLRELNAERVAAADLIITTVPLTLSWQAQIDIIHVHPMLRPQDITALTQWMA